MRADCQPASSCVATIRETGLFGPPLDPSKLVNKGGKTVILYLYTCSCPKSKQNRRLNSAAMSVRILGQRGRLQYFDRRNNRIKTLQPIQSSCCSHVVQLCWPFRPPFNHNYYTFFIPRPSPMERKSLFTLPGNQRHKVSSGLCFVSGIIFINYPKRCLITSEKQGDKKSNSCSFGARAEPLASLPH